MLGSIPFIFIQKNIHGISLKFPKWFIKWFYNFGPLPEIFPQNVKEVYDYFKETSTFVPGYRMISFYVIIPQYEEEITDMKLLTTKVNVKWWKKFNTVIINKTKIVEWLKNNKAKKGLPPKLELNKELLFLLEKQRLMAELVASTTAKEFYSKAKSLKGVAPKMSQMKSKANLTLICETKICSTSWTNKSCRHKKTIKIKQKGKKIRFQDLYSQRFSYQVVSHLTVLLFQ
ncbi:hypothetical protein CR513_53113, partial [Mucuna pruriens]